MRVVSTNGVKIFTSERVLYGDSFNEVMGYPATQLTTEYWFPWYDNVSMDDLGAGGQPDRQHGQSGHLCGGCQTGLLHHPGRQADQPALSA